MTTQTITLDKTQSKFWQASLLISGTCIGGGMLALPVQTAESGFFFSICSLFFCWMFMVLTGLFLTEATLWIKGDSHFSSLSRLIIGHGAKTVAIFVYLFMNYASLVAYVSGGANLLSGWADLFFNFHLPYEIACVVFTFVFGFILFLGAQIVSKLNFWLVILLALSYFALVSFGLQGISLNNLVFKSDIRKTLFSLPTILTTFSYQMIVPSVCSMLSYDAKMLKRAILIGTGIPCFIYMLWVFVIHGVVPLEGAFGLKQALLDGHAATTCLRSRFDHPFLTLTADLFGFLAVVTSYLGLSIALFDFLKDCLKEIQYSLKQNQMILLTIAPALALSIFFPKALLQCLDISGGFGDTILSGIIPVGMVWIGRYHKKLEGEYQVFGGKSVLFVTGVFFLVILLKEIFRFI
jgi:tyrosine-specific transport protein